MDMANIKPEKPGERLPTIFLGGVLIARQFRELGEQLAETDIKKSAVLLSKLTASLDCAIRSVDLPLPAGLQIQILEVEHIKTRDVGCALYLPHDDGLIEPVEFAQIAAHLKSDCKEWLAQALRDRAGPQQTLDFDERPTTQSVAGTTFSENFCSSFLPACDVMPIDPDRSDHVQPIHFSKIASKDPVARQRGQQILVGRVTDINSRRQTITFAPTDGTGPIQVTTERAGEELQLFLLARFSMECTICCNVVEFARHNLGHENKIYTYDKIVSREQKAEAEIAEYFENMRAAFAQIPVDDKCTKRTATASSERPKHLAAIAEKLQRKLAAGALATPDVDQSKRTGGAFTMNNTVAPTLVAAPSRRHRKKRQPV